MLTRTSAEELKVALELVRSARLRGTALTGPGGLLKALTKTVIEAALDEEMADNLGYDRNDPAGSGNSGNGARIKTVLPTLAVRSRSRYLGTATAASTRRS